MMKASSCSVSAWRARLRSCTSVPSPNSWASRLGVATCFILDIDSECISLIARSFPLPHPADSGDRPGVSKDGHRRVQCHLPILRDAALRAAPQDEEELTGVRDAGCR